MAFARVVAAIPRGRVASYGDVAVHAGRPGAARQVGRWLFHLPAGSRLPWHRVLNAAGRVSSSPSRRGSDARQRELLESERVVFDALGRVDLERFRWRPASHAVRSTPRGRLAERTSR